MKKDIIKLSIGLVTQLLQQAQTSPNLEICGLISENKGNQFICYPIDNISINLKKEFEMSPYQQIAAMRLMREQKETLFAIYHSHPYADAEMSLLDREKAYYFNIAYLIISLNTQGVLLLQGFMIRKNSFERIAIEIG